MAAHGNARLRNLALSGATLTPAFNEYVLEYAATVLDTATQTTISHDAADSAATVSYLDSSNNALTDADTSAGATGFQVSLPAGETVFYARIVGNTVLSGIPLLGSSIYKFTVTKRAPLELTGLTVNPGTLTPAFAAATTSYTVPDVGYGDHRITINATPEAGAAVSFLDGDDMALADADGAAGHQVDLDPGDNTVKVRVTKGTNTQDYTLVITRAKPTVSIVADAAEAGEGDAVTFTVSRGSATADALAVTVNVSEDGDLVPAANEGEKTVNITANSSSATLTVQTDAGDSVWEEHSTITAAAAAKDHYTVSTTNGSATTLVKDDDFPTATASFVGDEVTEGGVTTNLVVEVRTVGDKQPHRDAGTVTVRTTDDIAVAGTDYAAVDQTFNVAVGNFSRNPLSGGFWTAFYTVQMQITDDSLDEPDETFNAALTATDSQITVGSGSVSKQISLKDNDDPPSLSINDVTGDEGSDLVFTVTLSPASAKTVTVMYATSGGSATQGTDYTAKSGTLTFNPSDTTKTITVQTTDDTDGEDAETFTVTLSNQSNAIIGDGAATGTIRASDAVADTDAPQPVITLDDSEPGARDFKLEISFGEAVTGFTKSDIKLNDAWSIESTATLTAESAPGDYSVLIVPSPDVAGLYVTLNVTIAAGAAQDTASTPNASLEGTLSLILEQPMGEADPVDNRVYTGPATFIVMVDPTDADGPFDIEVYFLNEHISGRPVTGFGMNDIDVTGGIVSNFMGHAPDYGPGFVGSSTENYRFTATITPSCSPSLPCAVTVDVARDKATSVDMTQAFWEHLHGTGSTVDPNHTPRPNHAANTLSVRREATSSGTYVRALALHRDPNNFAYRASFLLNADDTTLRETHFRASNATNDAALGLIGDDEARLL